MAFPLKCSNVSVHNGNAAAAAPENNTNGRKSGTHTNCACNIQWMCIVIVIIYSAWKWHTFICICSIVFEHLNGSFVYLSRKCHNIVSSTLSQMCTCKGFLGFFGHFYCRCVLCMVAKRETRGKARKAIVRTILCCVYMRCYENDNNVEKNERGKRDEERSLIIMFKSF